MSAAARTRLDDCLAEIADASDLPALGSSLQQILAAPQEDNALRALTNIILRDLSLTLRVLRTANSALYNRSDRAINSVSHAVALLGTDTVRQLCTSAMLLEHFRRKSPGIRELILLSLLTANHARELAARTASPGREQAYLCGMFRNLGEVLIACYRPHDYAAILLHTAEGHRSEEAAARERIGATYEELAAAAARRWKMPPGVADSLEVDERTLARKARAGDTLPMIVLLAHRLTQAIYRREESAVRARLNLAVDRFGRPLGLGPEEVRGAIDAAFEETKGTFALLKVPVDQLRLQRQMDEAAALLREHEGADPAEEASSATPAETLARLLGELRALPFDGIAKAPLLTLEAIQRGGPFDRAVLARWNPASRSLDAVTALGVSSEQLADTFPIAADPLLASTLASGRDVFFPEAVTGPWAFSSLVRTLQPLCFGLFPLQLPGPAFGCLYSDRTFPGPDFDADLFAGLQELRNVLVERTAEYPELLWS